MVFQISTIQVKIDVNDVNNKKPYFINTPYFANISEVSFVNFCTFIKRICRLIVITQIFHLRNKLLYEFFSISLNDKARYLERLWIITLLMKRTTYTWIHRERLVAF